MERHMVERTRVALQRYGILSREAPKNAAVWIVSLPRQCRPRTQRPDDDEVDECGRLLAGHIKRLRTPAAAQLEDEDDEEDEAFPHPMRETQPQTGRQAEPVELPK